MDELINEDVCVLIVVLLDGVCRVLMRIFFSGPLFGWSFSKHCGCRRISFHGILH